MSFIRKLVGVLESVDHESIVLDVHGVGYLLYCTTATIRELPELGSPLSMIVEMHQREENTRLYGFFSEQERQCFVFLQRVQGVSARLALNILSALTIQQLIEALMYERRELFAKALGVGPRLASRITTELKDKIPKPLLNTSLAQNLDQKVEPSVANDVVSALTQLGYSAPQAYEAVQNVYHSTKESASVPDLIRACLLYLQKSHS